MTHAPTIAADDPLLTIRGLRTHITFLVARCSILDGIDLDVPRGRTVCIVGESGCGKTTTGRCIIRTLDADRRQHRLPSRGQVPHRRRLGSASANCDHIGVRSA